MWCETPEGLSLFVKVIPKARRTECIGWEGGRLKFRIAAPPEKGKANKELTRALSDLFGIGTTSISVVSGESSRNKRVFLAGVTAEKAHNALLSLQVE